MKFSNTALWLFAAGAYSFTIKNRDATSFEVVLSNVRNGIDGVAGAAKSFNGNMQPVVDESNKLIAVINSGTTTVKASAELSFGDALAIVTPVQELRKHAQALEDEFKSHLAAIERAKGCALTRTQLAEISDKAHILIDCFVAKVPPLLRSIADGLVSKITAILDDAKASFAEGNCVDAA